MLLLLGASFADAFAIVGFLVALIVQPPPYQVPGSWLHRTGLVTVLAVGLSVRLGLSHDTLGAMAAGAIGLIAMSACIVFFRARRTDGGWGDGGGGPGDDEDPPTGPQGPVDWNRFEEEFWA